MDVADTHENNDDAFGRPGASRGTQCLSSNPLRLLGGERHARAVRDGYGSLFHGRSHIDQVDLEAFKTRHAVFGGSEFSGVRTSEQAQATGADLLWRGKKHFAWNTRKSFPTVPLSHIYPSERDRRKQTNAIPVRVIEYTLEGVADAEPMYRLVTNVLDQKAAPAEELAALYHERWEIETALDELKTHLRGAKSYCAAKLQIS